MPGLSPKRQGERGFSLLLVVFSVTAFWQSYTISGLSGLATPGVFPMLASATMIVAAACILVQSFREAPRPSPDLSPELNPDLSPELSPDVNPDAIATETSAHNVLTLRLVLMVLLISGYIFAMPAVGFIVASAAFLFLSFSYLWRKSLMVSLLITACSVASVYFIFRQLFQVVLPSGTLLQGLF